MTTDSAILIFYSLLKKELLQNENGFFLSSATEEIDKVKVKILKAERVQKRGTEKKRSESEEVLFQ